MSDRVRVALTLAVLSVEFVLLLNAASGGRAGEWTIRQAKLIRWRLARPVLLEQQTKRDAARLIWEAIETTREAAEHDHD